MKSRLLELMHQGSKLPTSHSERVTANPEVTRRATTAVQCCHKGNGRVDHKPPGMAHSSVSSRFQDGKVIGVVDEDAAEEPHCQDAVEPLCAGVVLDTGEAEKGYIGQLA